MTGKSRPQTTPCAIAHSFPFRDIAADPNFARTHVIRTKIRGVSHKNSDGISRQTIIRHCCKIGDALCLVREPSNPFDANAVEVRRIVCVKPDEPIKGEQLGYISKELAIELAPRLDDGSICFAEITEVTGDITGENGEHVGVNIRIEEFRRVAASTSAS